MQVCPEVEAHMRTTDRAGVRLGMKAPVEGVIVFCLACRAHRKDAHSRLVPIIRHILDNRKAGTTIGAVGERIAVAPVSGIEELTQTVVTGGGIGRDKCMPFGASLAMGNDEGALMERQYHFGDNGIDTCQGRGLLVKCALEVIERPVGTFDLDGHTAAIIQHKAN